MFHYFSGASRRRRWGFLRVVGTIGLGLGLTAAVALGLGQVDRWLPANSALAQSAGESSRDRGATSAEALSVEQYHQLQQLRDRLGLDTSSLIQADCDQVQAEQALSQMKIWWKSHHQQLEQLDLQERQAENRCYQLLRQFHTGGSLSTDGMQPTVSASEIRSAAQQWASHRRDRQQWLDQARDGMTGHLSMDQRDELAAGVQRHRVARGELAVKASPSSGSLNRSASSSQELAGGGRRRSPSSCSNAAVQVNQAEERLLPMPVELRQQMELQRQRMLQPVNLPAPSADSDQP